MNDVEAIRESRSFDACLQHVNSEAVDVGDAARAEPATGRDGSAVPGVLRGLPLTASPL